MTKMDKNIIRELKLQAEKAWLVHFNKCSEQNVWTILNATLYDIEIVGMSWKLKWIEQKLDEYIKEPETN